MFNLIRKDFLIIKKMVLIVFGLSILVPIFLNFVADDMVLPFVMTNTSLVLILGIMLLSSIYEEEEKFPKARALITTIGYDRKFQIRERYIVSLIIFLFMSLITSLESFFLRNIGGLNLIGLAVSFTVFCLIYGLFFLLTTRYGIRASRYISVAIILFISLGPSLIGNLNLDLSFLKTINLKLIAYSFLGLAIVFYLVSYKLSVKTYEAMDL